VNCTCELKFISPEERAANLFCRDCAHRRRAHFAPRNMSLPPAAPVPPSPLPDNLATRNFPSAGADAEESFDAALDEYVKLKPHLQHGYDLLTDRLAALSTDEKRAVYDTFAELKAHSSQHPLGGPQHLEQKFCMLLFGASPSTQEAEALAFAKGACKESTLAQSEEAAKERVLDAAAKEEAHEEALCTICFDVPRNVRFRPCHHSTMCDGCVLKLIARSENRKLICLTCRTPVERLCREGSADVDGAGSAVTDSADGAPLKPVRKPTFEPPRELPLKPIRRPTFEPPQELPLKPVRMATFDQSSTVDGLPVDAFITSLKSIPTLREDAEKADEAWNVEVDLTEAVCEDDL